MKNYPRIIKDSVKAKLFEKGKILVLYGPRQVGKTTLAKEILRDYQSEQGYFNCEVLIVREGLMSESPDVMRDYFGGHKIVVFDEAQAVPNIGRALKILIDAYPEMTVIATGSSSFDLANKINEPLTGRHYEFFLPPLATEELLRVDSRAQVIGNLPARLIYGNYPEVVNAVNVSEAREKLELLATSYLYKDILQYNAIRNSEVLMNILKALAHQVGGEVSYNEIAGLVGVDRKTVMSYVGLLEQAFIIFRLPPLTRNARNEIKKLHKIYFYDNGMVNALTRNFSGAESGRNMGGLWENYMVSERIKYQKNHRLYAGNYFWRKTGGGEVDFIEEYDGRFHPFEIKYSSGKASSKAGDFAKEYADADGGEVVNRENFLRFVGGV